MSDYPQHCADCGAWLATTGDIEKHAEWHTWLAATLIGIRDTGELAAKAADTALNIAAGAHRLAEHADTFHRPIGGTR